MSPLAQETSARTVAWRSTVSIGAGVGIVLTLVYGLVFVFYAVGRSSLTIWATTPAEAPVVGTLAANALSLTVASLAITGLLTIVSAVAGAGTAVILRRLLAMWNPGCALRRALLTGLLVSLGLVALYQLALQAALGRPLPTLGVATYLFWLGSPGFLYIGASVWGAWRLNLYQAGDVPTPGRPGSATAAQQQA